MPLFNFGRDSLKFPFPSQLKSLIHAFQSLEIKLKLSLIIALIVIFVVTIFSVPVVWRQEDLLTSKVRESSRFIAFKLSRDVRDIILCELTGECNPDGSVEEQLGLLVQAKVEGLKFAYAVNKNGKITVKPDSMRTRLQFADSKVNQLLAVADFGVTRDAGNIEYFHPVSVKKSDGENVTIGVVGIGFDRATLEAPIERTKNWILSTAFLIIVVSVLGIYFLAQRMVTYITEIVEAARQVGMGNLDVHLQPRSKDEIGLLAHEFNNMVKHLREKLQMQKFVSKLTMQMIQERNGSRLRLAEGERHHITILFSDVRNFTTIAERLEPEQIVKLINIYFQLQTEIIEKHGGIVDKYMGDQIMAIFPTGNMLQNAIAAAIEIQQRIRELNQKRTLRKEVLLEVGIGLNHGAAVLGNMGSRHRMDYTVIGDIVNIASRLCSIARAGQIIAATGAIATLTGHYQTTRMQPIIVKGRSGPVEICQIDYEHDYIM